MADSFDLGAYTREVEAAAQAGGWTVRYLSPVAAGSRPWLQRGPVRSPQRGRLYFSSGIHGDEISGPLALLELLRRPDFFADFDTTIFPILNPDGLVRGIRENGHGLDLNRDYRNPQSPEIADHVAVLQTLGRFDAAMLLHEDYEGIGAYIYQLNETLPQTLGDAIIAAMGRHVPIDQRLVIEEVPAHGGVIDRRELIALNGPIENREQWPEAIYLSVHHTSVSYTTETPKPFPLEQRVAAQIAAVTVLLETLRSRTC